MQYAIPKINNKWLNKMIVHCLDDKITGLQTKMTNPNPFLGPTSHGWSWLGSWEDLCGESWAYRIRSGQGKRDPKIVSRFLENLIRFWFKI